jgi:hypothetical protein
MASGDNMTLPVLEDHNSLDKVLDEYRKGDADERMTLFLYHRELRDVFEKMEQNDPLDLFAVRKKSVPAEER